MWRFLSFDLNWKLLQLRLYYCPFAVCCCCCFSWKIRCYYFFGIGNFSHIVHVNQSNKITHWVICCFFFSSLFLSLSYFLTLFSSIQLLFSFSTYINNICIAVCRHRHHHHHNISNLKKNINEIAINIHK